MKIAKLSAVIMGVISMTLSMQGGPISSAPFEKALMDAEMIASLNPDWNVHRTTGDSMGDFFGDHSLIIVRKTAFEKIREGMVVVYQTTSGQLISHKVVSRQEHGLRTKGDANLKIDPETVSADRVIGTVFCVFHSKEAPDGVALSSDGEPIPTAFCRRF